MNNLRMYRQKALMTQEQLAGAIGMEQGAISHYENHRRMPDLQTCRLIVAALNRSGLAVTIDQVFPPAESDAA